MKPFGWGNIEGGMLPWMVSNQLVLYNDTVHSLDEVHLTLIVFFTKNKWIRRRMQQHLAKDKAKDL